MTTDDFWLVIEAARHDSHGTCAAHTDALVKRLTRRSLEDVHSFTRVMDEQLDRAYSWDLWGAAYVINGGCSDDGFEYFRGWLLAMGRDVFEAAHANPESLAGVASADCECEEFLYAPVRAVEEMTGSDELPPRYAPFPSEPSGGEVSGEGP
jgi:hypothetical protein